MCDKNAQNTISSYLVTASSSAGGQGSLSVLDDAPAPQKVQGSILGKRKRPDHNQLTQLEKLFARNPYPCHDARGALSYGQLMDKETIDNWFRNKRKRMFSILENKESKFIIVHSCT